MNYINELMNFQLKSPLYQATIQLYPLLYHEYFHPDEELDAITSKQYGKEEISRFINHYLKESQYEWLI